VNNRMTTVLWFLLGVSLTLAAVLGIMVLSDDDGDGGAASTEATTTTTSSTTTSSDTSTTAATTTTAGTTTSAGNACDGVPSATTPPIPSPDVSLASGDFDHDGAMDLLIGYESGGTYWIQMALDYGYATEIEAMDAAEAIGAQPFAEGDAWLGLAKVGTGASTDILQWFMLDGCDIVKATVDGIFEASFISGGGVMHGDGLECTVSGFITRSVQTSDGTNWEYFTNTYTWDPVGRTFNSGGVASSTLVSPADDDIIFSAYAVVCPFAP
jgi:hypothetical protein